MATDIKGNYCVDTTKAFNVYLSDESPIAFLVMQEMKRGKSCAQAIDFICGEGSFKKFAKEIYLNIRNK